MSPPTTASGGWKKLAICGPSGWTSTVLARRRESRRATAWLPWMGTTSVNVGSLERQLYRVGVWSKANYSLVRQGVPLEAPLIPAPADRTLYGGLRLIALVYLGIGLYVLLRRWTAPRSAHFYIFCLVSFIFYSFHYTGKLNDFDWIVYWSNVVAWLLQPALFLHFSLVFPERKRLVNRRPWLIPAVYVPFMLLLAAQICAVALFQPSEQLRWSLDRVSMSYLAAYFVLAAYVLWHSYRNAETAILRQQMKWVTRGTILAVAPFTIFYVIPYLSWSTPTLAMKVSVLSLVFLPLTFGYAIFRYRLMDVDLIFKRGMAYTIAAGAITAAYFAAVGVASVLFHQNFPSAGPMGLILAIAVTALLFNPFKNWVQDYLDKFFYRKRYDYRKTLIEFGRDLNSETDLDKMLTSIVDRLSRTLLVDRLAIFSVESRRTRPVLAGEVVRHCEHRRAESRLPAHRAAGVAGRPLVLRQHASCGARDAARAGGDPPAGPELLHPVHRDEPHDRRAGPGQDP